MAGGGQRVDLSEAHLTADALFQFSNELKQKQLELPLFLVISHHINFPSEILLFILKEKSFAQFNTET